MIDWMKLTPREIWDSFSRMPRLAGPWETTPTARGDGTRTYWRRSWPEDVVVRAGDHRAEYENNEESDEEAEEYNFFGYFETKEEADAVLRRNGWLLVDDPMAQPMASPRETDASVLYDTLRWTLRKLREPVHSAIRVPSRGRDFALGLLYDAMGWTDREFAITNIGVATIVQAFRVASSVGNLKSFVLFRRRLINAGFAVAPPAALSVAPSDDSTESDDR